MVLSSVKPKIVNNANSFTCISEQERRKGGGKSQGNGYSHLIHRNISEMLMPCVSEHLPFPPGKPQPWAESTTYWICWLHRARGCWWPCTGHRPSLPAGDTQNLQRYRKPRIAGHNHGRRLTFSWQTSPLASWGQWLWNSRGRRRRGDWGKSTRVYAARDPS